MKVTLNKAVQDKYDHIVLSGDQIARLQVMQTPARKALPPRRARYWWSALVASVAAVAVTLTLLWPLQQDADSLIDEIAAEVVKNHLHMKPLEVTADRLDTLQGYFTKLPFRLVESRYLADRGLVLLGGRYCSLQKVTAAQLRFKKSGGNEVHTLYEVGYDANVFRAMPNYDQGAQPMTTWANGIKVTLWIEKGILFALTEERPDESAQTPVR